MSKAKQLERARRWLAPHRSMVSHPKYGSVIVPHLSKISAIENAAEFWKCSIMDIIHDAKVEWVEPDAGPLRRPKEFCKPKGDGP